MISSFKRHSQKMYRSKRAVPSKKSRTQRFKLETFLRYVMFPIFVIGFGMHLFLLKRFFSDDGPQLSHNQDSVLGASDAQSHHLFTTKKNSAIYGAIS